MRAKRATSGFAKAELYLTWFGVSSFFQQPLKAIFSTGVLALEPASVSDDFWCLRTCMEVDVGTDRDLSGQ